MTLGGTRQWVLTRGRRADAPLLLKVHGGPGQAEMATVRQNTLLESDFVVVEWDQRGAGKSAAAIEPRSAMTLAQIVADTIELSEWLLRRHRRDRLILVGHSWGSVVAMHAVQQRPDLFGAVVTTGQIADFVEGQAAAHRFVLDEAERRGESKARDEVLAPGNPPCLGAEGLPAAEL